MDSGPERRGQLKTQHGSHVFSVHLRNGGSSLPSRDTPKPVLK
jgi:hypothetical protein